MPPKIKITKEEIIHASIEIIRKSGQESLNTRNIAASLSCSTQPIFSNFANMEQLHTAVRSYAHNLYLSFLDKEDKKGIYPKYKAFGMAYIRFAKEERELFKFLFMCDNGAKQLPSNVDREASIELIMQSNAVSRATAELMQLEMWVFVHGIATMIATAYLTLDEALISDMLTDIYQGSRTRHLSKENLQ